MPSVQILTTPGCAACARVKEMLDILHQPYETIDVTQRPEYLEKYPILTAPGIVIDGRLAFSGVPELEELRNALEKQKRPLN